MKLEKTELCKNRTAIFYKIKRYDVTMFLCLIINENGIIVKEVTGLRLAGLKAEVYTLHGKGKI